MVDKALSVKGLTKQWFMPAAKHRASSPRRALAVAPMIGVVQPRRRKVLANS
ncbi:hypothetical protein D3C81_1476890 [compost metagenome]